jgi:MFS family permease
MRTSRLRGPAARGGRPVGPLRRRRALVVGLGLFGLGSALAPFVQTAEQLILLRAFMGVGAALTMPSTLSIIGDVFEADERPKAIAAWSAVSGLGIVIGPVAGGWLLEHFAWGAVSRSTSRS